MKYFNNRFDFLRIYNAEVVDFQYPSDNDVANQYKDFLLPFGENVVTGSTCYYVNKGDLFIYFKSGNQGFWCSQTDYSIYEEGENPYYSSEEEPDDDGGVS